MKETENLVSIIEFKRVLIDLKEKRPDICVRIRVLGEMWNPNFMRVINITESGAIFNDEASNRLVRVKDLTNIMQFELDHRFQNFQPHFHYSLKSLLASGV